MASRALVIAFAIILTALSPSAEAAKAHGEIEASRILLPGPARIEVGRLDVVTNGSAPPQIELTLEDVVVQRFGISVVRNRAPPTMSISSSEIDERANFSIASVSLRAGEGDQLTVLRAARPGSVTIGSASVRGVSSGTLAEPANDNIACKKDKNSEYCFDVLGVYEVTAAATFQLLGDGLTILLYGPTLDVSSGGERFEYDSGVQESASAGAISISEDTWVALRARRATGGIHSENAALYSAVPLIRAAGVEFEGASGSIRVGSFDYRPSGELLAVEGSLLIAPATLPRVEIASAEPLSYTPTFTTALGGEVLSIDLGASPAFRESTVNFGIVAFIALLVAAAVYAWQHIAFFAAAIYTRLRPARTLDSASRARILAHILQEPAANAREIQRAVGLAWGETIYHLRILERHSYVEALRAGRQIHFFPAGTPRQDAVLRIALRRPLAERVRAELSGSAVTDSELARRLGTSRSAVRRTIRALENAGAIARDR